MRILIHAVPQRLWYVENFMLPELGKQGAENVSLWVDREKLGNLESCLQSFEQLPAVGGTWHVQDDVLFAKDFVRRAESFSGPLANGFCCIPFLDSPHTSGQVYMPDAWHSFQCVYIRNDLAREFAGWVRSGQWVESPEGNLQILRRIGRGDDSFFREFMLCRYPDLFAFNFAPNLVEHVDWLIGGSTLNQNGSWHFYLPRSALWEDAGMVADLQARIRAWKAEHQQTTP